MADPQFRSFLESALVTSGGPVAPSALAEAWQDGSISETEVTDALLELKSEWERDGRGIRLEQVAGGWRCVTPVEMDHALRTLHGLTAKQRLSQAALEVLSIVAYRQPVTLPEVNFIRGANSAAVVRTLLDRRLIRMSGRKKVVGKPFLYRTTRDFLIHFGLDRLEELPDPETFDPSGADPESV